VDKGDFFRIFQDSPLSLPLDLGNVLSNVICEGEMGKKDSPQESFAVFEKGLNLPFGTLDQH